MLAVSMITHESSGIVSRANLLFRDVNSMFWSYRHFSIFAPIESLATGKFAEL